MRVKCADSDDITATGPAEDWLAKLDRIGEEAGYFQTLGPRLLGLKSTGVFHTGVIPPGCVRLGTTSRIQVIGNPNAQIGLFVDGEGRDHALVVNTDTEQTLDLRLSLRPSLTPTGDVPDGDVVSISPVDGRENPVEVRDRTFGCSLDPGDGRLYRLP